MIKKTLSFIGIFLIFSTPTRSSAEALEPEPINAVIYPDSIYNQDSLILNQDFLSLPLEKQNKKLENLLLRNKRNYLRTKLKNSIIPRAAIFLWGTALFFMIKYIASKTPHQQERASAPSETKSYAQQLNELRSSKKEEFSLSEKTVLLSLLGLPLSSILILPPFYHLNILNANYDGYGTTAFMKEVETKYIHRKRFYPKSLQQTIESNFSALRRLQNVSNKNYDLVKLAVDLPYETTKLSFDKDKLESTLKYYSEEVKERLLTIANHEYVGQKHVKKHGNLQRKSVYLVGPPGVGKTLAAEKFAESLGLPFVRISLEGRSIDDLIGRSIKSDNMSEGIIANQIIEKNKYADIKAKNMVIFLDEVDHALMDKRYGEEILAFLLKLLDPDSKSFYNPFFETDIDTSQWTIFLAGNHKLDHAALSNRMSYIYFDGFSKDAKKELLWNDFVPKIIKNYNDNVITQEEITPQEIEMINASIDIDQDPGLRTVQQFMMDFLEYKIAQKDNIFHLKPFKGKEKMRELNQFLDEYISIKNIRENHQKPNAAPAA